MNRERERERKREFILHYLYSAEVVDTFGQRHLDTTLLLPYSCPIFFMAIQHTELKIN